MTTVITLAQLVASIEEYEAVAAEAIECERLSRECGRADLVEASAWAYEQAVAKGERCRSVLDVAYGWYVAGWN